jgi:hypothetical protein
MPTAKQCNKDGSHINPLIILHNPLVSNHTACVPVVLYEFESWSLMLREGHRLKILKNRVPSGKWIK